MYNVVSIIGAWLLHWVSIMLIYVPKTGSALQFLVCVYLMECVEFSIGCSRPVEVCGGG